MWRGGRPPNFSWLIPREVAGSGLPNEGSMEWLFNKGVRAILTLREHPLPTHWVEKYGFDYLFLYVEDFHAPTQEQLDQAISFMHRCISQGKPVLAHCLGGYGRTGTVLAAYLVSIGYSAKQAIAEVRRKRPGSIEAGEQENAVYVFEKRLRERQLP